MTQISCPHPTSHLPSAFSLPPQPALCVSISFFICLPISLCHYLCSPLPSLCPCCAPVPSLAPVLPQSATCFPSCCSFPPTFLIAPYLHGFMPDSSSTSAPCRPSGLHPFYPFTLPSSPLSHPRWLCLLPVLSLSSSALQVNSCPLFVSRDHHALKAMVPSLLSSLPLPV